MSGPEQLGCLATLQTGLASDKPSETVLQIPITGGVHVRLTVDGQEVGLSEAVIREGVVREGGPQETKGLLSLLDGKAIEWVQEYLRLNPWNYRTADVVNGAVISALSDVIQGMDVAVREEGLESPRFHDGAWGYVEFHIFNARQRADGRKEVVEPYYGWGGQKGIRRKPSTLTLKEVSEAPAQTAADRPDLALCAAGEVEPIGDQPQGSDEDDNALPDEDEGKPWGQSQPEPEGGN